MAIRVQITVILLAGTAWAGSQSAYAQQYSEIVSSSQSGPEFNFMGFGDINYISRDDTDDDGFVIGQLVGHMSASLGHSLSIFAEGTLNARDSEYTVEVERLIARYEFSDLIKLSAGRYHTPIGYWNPEFHHGSWLQTTASRPEVIRFGSKIVPIHFVGVLLEGNILGNNLGLSYSAGVGNGRHENVARAGDAGDINGDKAWMLKLQARPEVLGGLQFGIGFYSDEVDPDDRPEISETTSSAYAVWTGESPEVLFEYFHSEHEFVANNGVSGDVDAWYLQVGYRLPGERDQWKPYARYEYTDVDDDDPLLGDQALDYDAAIVGVRWDFNTYAALKAEYRAEDYADMGRENNFWLQFSFVLSRY